MENGIIIETKVSLLRRIIELTITVFFNLLIIFLIVFVIDDIYAKLTGTHLWFHFISPEISMIGWYGILVLPILFVLFFVISTFWMRFKRYLYNPDEHVMEEPEPVRVDDMAEYFQLSPEEIQRRQYADELVIHENIDNNRMIFLRKEHAKKTEEEKK